ncbi:MAG: 3-methyl-2-oxobutanoate hydroxymethyltransferase [Coriobacteriales bacterium]|jgi:3-methyl-2-oxobutanoate hydroxymethyltransferase
MARNTMDIFLSAKKERRKITMVTCYDYSLARVVDQTDIDCILIGDSLGMTMLGYESTLPVTMDDMIRATQSVVRGTTKPLIVADMPFMSYQASLEEGMRNAGRLLAEGGAGAVKIEGATPATVALIRELIDHGIPVVGHLGLTPQSVNAFGGFHAQATEIEGIAKLLMECESYAEAGVKAVVLECIPAELAKHITKTFPFATIGIGGGVECDGEVQVIHDVLGLSARKPRHANTFINGLEVLGDALRAYDQGVKDKTFPGPENSVHIEENLISKAEDYLDGMFDAFFDDDSAIDN